jgi:hypothetical protein
MNLHGLNVKNIRAEFKELDLLAREASYIQNLNDSYNPPYSANCGPKDAFDRKVAEDRYKFVVSELEAVEVEERENNEFNEKDKEIK